MRSLVITVFSKSATTRTVKCSTIQAYTFTFRRKRRRVLETRGGGGGGGGGTPNDGLYEVYERLGISLVEGYKG